jgi:hypothetical protein
MRPKIRCDEESTILLQNFLDLNWATVYSRVSTRTTVLADQWMHVRVLFYV